MSGSRKPNMGGPDQTRSSSGESGGQLRPTALPIADAAKLLTAAAGQRVRPEQIEADLEAGAPTNADGTINLVHYAAWLVREMSAPGRKGGRAFGD